MIKISVLRLLLILSTNANASKCVDQILAHKGRAPLSPERAQCMINHADFVSATQYLCSPNQDNISKEFKLSLGYEVQYKQTLELLKSEADPAQSPYLRELNRIETEWMIFGYRNEVEAAIDTIGSLEYRCRTNP